MKKKNEFIVRLQSAVADYACDCDDKDFKVYAKIHVKNGWSCVTIMEPTKDEREFKRDKI